MSAEPTAEQRAMAATIVHLGKRSTVDEIANLLAAAVTAEREKVVELYERVIADIQFKDEWGVPSLHVNTLARRIREVTT